MDKIYISDSNIKNAGKGIFAKTNLNAGIKLGEYIGKRYSAESYYNFDIDLPENKYVMAVFKKGQLSAIIDGLDGGNWTRLLNGAKTNREKKLINCEFYQYNQRIFVRTLVEIKKNEELIIDYGPSYNWD
jgi:SET domain-containing protein